VLYSVVLGSYSVRTRLEFARENKIKQTVPTLLPSVFLGGNLKLSATANFRRNYKKNGEKNNLVPQRTINLKLKNLH